MMAIPKAITGGLEEGGSALEKKLTSVGAMDLKNRTTYTFSYTKYAVSLAVGVYPLSTNSTGSEPFFRITSPLQCVF